MNEHLSQAIPETLWSFMRESCHVDQAAFRGVSPGKMPDRERHLLVHSRDMTTTLATFHESSLRVEILQCRRMEEFYLREVFLRTHATHTIVEYGVIGIALDQFTIEQREVIEEGQTPLGALLHRFQIPFVSAPIQFVAISAEALGATLLAAPAGTTCYGRFNRLSKPTGEPLAWILEIIPPA